MALTFELGGLIPGDAPVPIDEVYVELFADEWRDDSLNNSIFSQRQARVSTLERACISVTEMLNRTVDSCIVIGEPGAGKTTVLQWFAWAVGQKKIPDFDQALLIPLRVFSAEFDAGRTRDLVGFWVSSDGNPTAPTSVDEHARAADGIRKRGAESKRILLLLDGWDEVPNHLRNRIKTLIHQELAHFVIVLTSRATGLPRQVFPQHQTKIFEIAGLSPASIRTFVTRRLSLINKTEHFDPVMELIEGSRDLSGMAANPFLLGLLVHVLVSSNKLINLANRAEVYGAITNWVLTHSTETSPANFQVKGKHLQCLEQLAQKLVLSGRSPRFAFTEDELNQYLGDAASTPLTLSRFIFRVDISHHLWSYLHATLEEYFAVRSLLTLESSALHDYVDRMLLSQSRLVCLEFFAGLNEFSQQLCIRRAEHWLAQLDRYHVLVARLARVATAGGWKNTATSTYDRIMDQLWYEIMSDKEWKFARANIEVFAGIDRQLLIEKSLAEKKIDARIQETLCDVIPAAVLIESGLWEKLHKQLKEFVESRVTGHFDASAVKEVVDQLGIKRLGSEELRAILGRARQMGSSQVAEAILEKLSETEDEEQRDEIVLTIASMFRHLSNESLVKVLTQEHFPKELRKIAAKAICIAPDCGQRIDPHIRSTLLKCLPTLDKNDDRIEWILEALQFYPIRENAECIAALATNAAVNGMIRVTACTVLRTVTDDKAVYAALDTLSRERSVGMIDFLADLALYRRIRLPLNWLEECIRQLSTGIDGRLSKSIDLRELLGTFLRLADQQGEADRRRCALYIIPMILKCLRGEGDYPEDDALELSLDIRKLALIQDVLDAEPQIKSIAKLMLSDGLKSKTTFPGQIQLALELLRSDKGVVDLFCSGFQQVIRRCYHESEKRWISRFEAVASLMAEIVGEHDIDRLLGLANKYELADRVLCKRSQESGLTIVGTVVYDADGNPTSNEAKSPDNSIEPKNVQELLAGLPDSYRKAVWSYWLVKQRFSAKGPKEVYAIIKQSVGEELDGNDADFIQQAYGRRTPKFLAWRQALYRGINRLARTEIGSAFIKDLGLPRK